MVQNLQKARPQPLSLHDDAEIPNSSKNLILHLLQVVGHDDKYCRTMELMRERTLDAYRVQAKMMTGQAVPEFNLVPTPYNTA
jgi:hypothetical protein